MNHLGSPAAMRVGLVLGAGGSVGAAWLIGALDALESETGWSASDAQRIVGTSAGSAVGALVAQGIPPALMAAYAGGEALDDVVEAEHRALLAGERIETNQFRLQRALPPIGPGSWRMAVNTLRAPHSPQPPGGARRLAAARLRLHRADPAC